jgi:hypothetical protein
MRAPALAALATNRRLETRAKIPSWEGGEGFTLRGWVFALSNDPPLHPSRGGEFLFVVVPLPATRVVLLISLNVLEQSMPVSPLMMRMHCF